MRIIARIANSLSGKLKSSFVMARKSKIAPRKQPLQARSRETVTAILDATARVLVKLSYSKLTTNRVAEVAGVSVGSLYQYFPSKEALVDAVLDRHLEVLRVAVLAGLGNVKGLPLREATRELIEILVRAHASDRALHRVLLTELPRANRLERFRAWEVLLHAAIVQILAERKSELRPIDLPTAAFVVLVAVDGLNTASLLFLPDLPTGISMVDEATELVVRYLVR